MSPATAAVPVGMAKFSDIPRFPHAAYEIDVSWKDLETMIDHYVKDYGLNLDPEFQRSHVWHRHQQVAYVEYVLRGQGADPPFEAADVQANVVRVLGAEVAEGRDLVPHERAHCLQALLAVDDLVRAGLGQAGLPPGAVECQVLPDLPGDPGGGPRALPQHQRRRDTPH